MTLYLSRMHFPVTALGPGRRVGIWFQGCSIHCPGCISRDTWEPGQGSIELDAAMAALRPWLRQADGVTLSGGEPFDQPEGLMALLTSIRTELNGDVLIFTGYEFADAMARCPDIPADALITGPFVAAAGQTLPLRGSDNQELHLLTPLGEARFANLSHERKLDVFEDENGIWLAGIPRLEDWAALRQDLAEHEVTAEFSHQVPKG